MAQIIVVSESLERLQGFLIGIEWTNDSALSLIRVDAQQRTALLCDQDADEDRHWRLGPCGLEAMVDERGL
ncbi:hypothetical protein CKO42_17660 [Lamprobacter modestohalophilus]|uniref:Uncharacterized protein n=1 Tax=Lamprobacter modestohalophilus TaxID=1064514 RepID=A0A9X1B586_9GAMM|nr:hypothetical protein [Lamprobacter modestohalophilus]MBK1620235.1 hypothetical protein [Lamprobacter modestohalophilus]